MQIEAVPIDQLVFDPSNARKHEPKNLDAIKGSLVKFGQQKPIVIDKNNVVIAGNGTLAAALALKWPNINVVRSDLAGMEATAFAIADNRSAELAVWDDSVLSKTLEGLKAEGFALADIGFDDEDLAQWLKAPDVIPGCNEDEVPEHIEPKTKLGDLYQLGEHRLLCGDSTDVLQVERLMAGAKADICFTSPPYNAGKFEVTGKASWGKNMPRDTKYLTTLDDLTEETYGQLLQDILNVFILNTGTVMLNIGLLEPNKRAVVKILADNVATFKDIIYWRKATSTPHIQPGILTMLVEPIFCFGEHNSRQFKSGNFKGNLGNIIEGANASGNEFAKIHAATFPVYLPEWIASNFTEIGGSLVDPFLGSGSTLIACEKTQRKCYGMELDPHYCDVIVARWEKFSGKKANLVSGA